LSLNISKSFGDRVSVPMEDRYGQWQIEIEVDENYWENNNLDLK